MTQTILENEPQFRLAFFLGILALMALWELGAPRRRNEIPKVIRWTNNFGLVVVDTVLVRICFPIAAVGIAAISASNGWGIFNLVALPIWIEILLAFIILDLVIYLQHLVFHMVPVLWRLHRVHHADQDFDVTTALRFHPIEILLSMALKLAVVVMLGAPAIAVLIFEIVLNGAAMFNHSNVRLPKAVDRVLRLVLVTPDMHRVHHSVDGVESNRNFGFNLPWWDRLFGTYQSQPKDGHEDMSIGQTAFRTRRDQWLDRMLLQPFRRD